MEGEGRGIVCFLGQERGLPLKVEAWEGRKDGGCRYTSRKRREMCGIRCCSLLFLGLPAREEHAPTHRQATD